VIIIPHVKHVQDHKVKHSNRSNSAAYCSISLNSIQSFTRSQTIHYKMFERPNVKGQGHSLCLGLRTYGLGLVIKALTLTLRPRPGQTQCHCFIIIRINADEFDLICFHCVNSANIFLLLKPLLEVFSVYQHPRLQSNVFFQD